MNLPNAGSSGEGFFLSLRGKYPSPTPRVWQTCFGLERAALRAEVAGPQDKHRTHDLGTKPRCGGNLCGNRFRAGVAMFERAVRRRPERYPEDLASGREVPRSRTVRLQHESGVLQRFLNSRTEDSRNGHAPSFGSRAPRRVERGPLYTDFPRFRCIGSSPDSPSHLHCTTCRIPCQVFTF